MHKSLVRHIGAQVEMGPKIIGRQALKKRTQRTGQTGQAGSAFAVGEQNRAIAVANMHRPNTLHRIEPALLFNVETQGLQPGLHGGDGRFQRGVFAGDVALCIHAKGLVLNGVQIGLDGILPVKDLPALRGASLCP